MAFDCSGRDGVVEFTTVAVHFAKVRADSTRHGGARGALQHQLRCPLPVSLTNQRQISGNVNVGGAAVGAGKPRGPRSTEDRVIAIVTKKRCTLRATLPKAMKGIVGGPVVPAPRLLADVSTDGRHVANLRGTHGTGRLCQKGNPRVDKLVIRNLR